VRQVAFSPTAAIQCQATHQLTGDIKDFGPFMNHAKLKGSVVIQTASEFLDSFLKPKIKEGIKKKSFRTYVPFVSSFFMKTV
jgi:hypothetical protein